MMHPEEYTSTVLQIASAMLSWSTAASSLACVFAVELSPAGSSCGLHAVVLPAIGNAASSGKSR